MTGGWRYGVLADVCLEITDGSHVSPRATASGFPYITVRDIENDQIHFENCKFISDENYKQLLKNGCKPNKGDLLFSKDGTVGKVALVDVEREFVVLSSLAIIRPNSTRITSEFLKYVLKSPAFLNEAVGKKTGVAIRRIILRNLKSIPVPIPPLPDQRRIVAILDQSSNAIARSQNSAARAAADAEELFNAALHSALEAGSETWKTAPLESLVDKDCSLSYGIVQPGELIENGLPIVRPTDLSCKVVSLNGLKRIDPSLAESYQRTRLRGKDLLLCVRGSTGMVSVACEELKGGNVTRGIVPINFDAALISQPFGYYLLRSAQVQRQIREKTYGTTLMQINIGDLRKISVSFPDPVDQDRIVENLDALQLQSERLALVYRRKQDALTALSASLLNHVFSGNLAA